MVLAPIILSAILTGLATAGFINLTTKTDTRGNTTIFNESGQPIFTIPQQTISSEIPLTSIKATFKRVSGITDTSKPANPNIRLVNNIKNNRLYHVSIVPDATMKTDGVLEIEVNGSGLLKVDVGSLTDTDALNIPIPNEGLSLNQNTTIDFFVHTPSGGAVALTALTLTGVKPIV